MKLKKRKKKENRRGPSLFILDMWFMLCYGSGQIFPYIKKWCPDDDNIFKGVRKI
jgi:hypothetical protein